MRAHIDFVKFKSFNYALELMNSPATVDIKFLFNFTAVANKLQNEKYAKYARLVFIFPISWGHSLTTVTLRNVS